MKAQDAVKSVISEGSLKSIFFSLQTLIWTLSAPLVFAQEEPKEERKIEEVIVTAQRVEERSLDIPISLSTFDSLMIEDLGIQDANELVNYMISTTRDSFDVRIRGVGRNFRALGNEPGVASYYNGVFSEDALIALSENGVWDLERIEVLRGPQGTLYGRNSIGGAVNYITRGPTNIPSGTLRLQLGGLNEREFYGAISGPITDELGFRLNIVDRFADGDMKGVFGTEDIDGVDDSNISLTTAWQPNDSFNLKLRLNSRRSARSIGMPVILSEGWGDFRGTRRTDLFAFGLRPATSGTPGSYLFTDPASGAQAWGAPSRPGVDPTGSSPNPAYGSNPYINGDGDLNFDEVSEEALTNNLNSEIFYQSAASLNASFSATDTFSIKYIGGYQDFNYLFYYDDDFSNSKIHQSFIDLGKVSDQGEKTYYISHELQFFWTPFEKLQANTGLYFYRVNRNQDFAIGAKSQGRFTKPVNYGAWDTPRDFLAGVSLRQLVGFGAGSAVKLGDAPMGATIYGGSDGNEFGHVYRHTNSINTGSEAIYANATYDISDKTSVTFGIRWENTEKEAYENRWYYFEFDAASFIRPVLDSLAPLFGVYDDPSTLTNLALTNIMLGSAVPSGNLETQITPVCSFQVMECANPLRLGGLPLTGTSRSTDRKDFGSTTGKITYEWRPNSRSMVYGSVATAYRPGGYGLGIADARLVTDSGSLLPYSFDGEEVLSLEIGYKASLMEDMLRVSTAIYRYDYKGYQDQDFVFNELQGVYADLPTNTGDAHNNGFEIESTFLATQNLTLNASYSFADTAYKTGLLVQDIANFETPLSLFVSPPKSTEGQPLKGIPKHKATIYGDYTFNWAELLVSFFFSHNFTDSYSSRSLGSYFNQVPKKHRTDVALIFAQPDESVRLRFFIDNLFDQTNFYGVSAGGVNNNFRFTGNLTDKRRFGLDFIVRFGEG